MILSDKQKEEQPLLELELGIILPDSIDYNAYFEMLWAFAYATRRISDNGENEVVKLYCAGGGGNGADALAIVDLIGQCPYPVYGILLGEACSANSFIWASCSKRFVGPNSAIAVHYTSYTFKGQKDENGYNRFGASSIVAMGKQFTESDQIVRDIYVNASNESTEWWHKKLDTGGPQLNRIWAKKLVKIGMAEWL